MIDQSSQSEHVSEVDTALLDVELFIKYNAPEKAVSRLRAALESTPRSIRLRERLREVSLRQSQHDEAARQCLALASLYVERDEFDTAYDRLLEAKQLDASINIAGGLEAIRRARRPQVQAAPPLAAPGPADAYTTFAGDASVISIFDVIQVIENARLTGSLTLANNGRLGRVLFNDGRIVDAESADVTGEEGFRKIVEITDGRFEFQKSETGFEIHIKAVSNTNLILDSLRRLDEEKQ